MWVASQIFILKEIIPVAANGCVGDDASGAFVVVEAIENVEKASFAHIEYLERVQLAQLEQQGNQVTD